ncbi:LOW QUALITY PROTEIN: hypothetical protein ACHAXS_013426 [Conticribra weissflogii]
MTDSNKWNFRYVFPQDNDTPKTLVVTIFLQMGWVDSPPFFFAASDLTTTLQMSTLVHCLPDHKFLTYVKGDPTATALPLQIPPNTPVQYKLKVYIDDFINLDHIWHVFNGTMLEIHDVFVPDTENKNVAISLKNEEK